LFHIFHHGYLVFQCILCLNFQIFVTGMYFGLLLLGVVWLVLVSPLSFRPLIAYFPELFLWWSVLNPPGSPMLPYLRGRGPISPMFARLPAGRLPSKDQQGQHEFANQHNVISK
jgi:hypothetical protein